MANSGYEDDPTITNDAELYRRIPPIHFVRDANSGELRPSSAAFCDHPDGSPMSVVLADVLGAMGRRAEDVLANHSGLALAMITAGLARQCQQGVAREPLEEEPAHAVVFGGKTRAVMRRLARAARWAIPPL